MAAQINYSIGLKCSKEKFQSCYENEYKKICQENKDIGVFEVYPKDDCFKWILDIDYADINQFRDQTFQYIDFAKNVLTNFAKEKFNVEPKFCIATADSKELKKNSIHIIVYNILMTRNTQKNICKELNEFAEKFDKPFGNFYNEGSFFDDNAYNTKMRSVFTSKEGQQRYLTLIEGTFEQSVLTGFKESDSFIYAEPITIKPKRKTEPVNNDDLNFIQFLINGGLFKNRCDNHLTWIETGYALFNSFADEGLPLWEQLTELYGSANKNIECKNQWSYLTKETDSENKLRLGSLIKWAKDEDLTLFNTLTKKYETANDVVGELDETKFKQFDRKYFESLKGYTTRKAYFEKFVVKVLRPEPIYVYTESNRDVGKEMCFYTKSKITDAFAHLKSGDNKKNGDEITFINKWIYDPNILCYNEMDFIPYNGEFKNTSVFNLFTGFNPLIHTPYDKSKKEKILKPWNDLVLQLCGGNETHFNYYLKFLAQIIQNPSAKIPIAFIFKGNQGTGKSIHITPIGNILGNRHFISSANPKDFFGDYAEGFYHKLLVNMNECEGKDTFDFEGKIKSFITEDKITLNQKFIRPITINNYARVLIFTNKQNPIPLDVRTKERRWVVFETTDHFLQKQYGSIFWSKMNKHFNTPEFISCLYDFLNNMDISNVDWKNERPITNAYKEMAKLYIPVEAMFLQEKVNEEILNEAKRQHIEMETKNKWLDKDEKEKLIEEMKTNVFNTHKTTITIPGSQLYAEYCVYHNKYFKRANSTENNLKKFYANLRELKLNSLSTKMNHNLVHFSFDTYEITREMINKGWLDTNDMNEIECDVNKGESFDDLFEI